MGFLDEVISAAMGAKASPAQNPPAQMAPQQDQFSQIAAALQELLAPKQGPVPGGQAAASTAAAQQSSSGLIRPPPRHRRCKRTVHTLNLLLAGGWHG